LKKIEERVRYNADGWNSKKQVQNLFNQPHHQTFLSLQAKGMSFTASHTKT